MTGFAQVTAEAQDGRPGFTLTLKSVNHRFLDLGLRLPGDSEALDIKLRRALKDKIARGHVDVTLAITPGTGQAAQVNREVVGQYVNAFRAAAEMFAISGEPDLNTALRMPGAMNASTSPAGMSEALQDAIVQELDVVVAKLNAMREQEGAAIMQELRDRIGRLSAAVEQVASMRERIAQAAYERLRSKMAELLNGSEVNQDRLLQEAALMAERSDVQEEVARLRSHIEHFLSLLEAGGEVGKKLDFLMQEFNREANTLLSKTTGIAGEGIKITELGLTMKSEIEKLREQVQNLE
jgi:uncharacterized protein (TIGR00255 family)